MKKKIVKVFLKTKKCNFCKNTQVKHKNVQNNKHCTKKIAKQANN